MNNKGYIMSLSSFFLILPAFLLIMIVVDLSANFAHTQEDKINSHEVLGVATDLETNLPLIGREVLRDKSLEVVNSGIPLSNSRKGVKEELQVRMDTYCSRCSDQGMLVECIICKVDNSYDPFLVEVKSIINVEKGNLKHHVNLTQNISLTNGSFPICDPLPFLKCRSYGGAILKEERIYYGSSLANYLKMRGIKNYGAYENATSPLYIKKCPYDPYILHGNTDELINLKNCIDNGYYHESSDGSCFLCRLEGKGVCSHYGMETFIIPSPIVFHCLNNSSIAPSSVDHVIFNDTGNGTYSGHPILYFSGWNQYFYLYLDDSHRQKYGVPVF